MTKHIDRPMRAVSPRGPSAAQAAIAGQGTPAKVNRLSTFARRLRNKHTSPQAGAVIVGPRQQPAHSQVYTGYDAGQDALGVSLTGALDNLYGHSLTPFAGGGGDRFGMKGAPVNSFRGDLGPLQIVEPVAVGAASRGVRSGMAAAKALPGTNGPGGQVNVQDLIGPSF